MAIFGKSGSGWGRGGGIEAPLRGGLGHPKGYLRCDFGVPGTGWWGSCGGSKWVARSVGCRNGDFGRFSGWPKIGPPGTFWGGWTRLRAAMADFIIFLYSVDPGLSFKV